MKEEQIIDAFNFIDENLVTETDRIRKNSKPKKRHVERLGALAACICLIAAVAVFSIPQLLLVGAKGAGNLGTLANGKYFFISSDTLYSYTPDEKQRILSLSGKSEWVIDDYGVFYTSGSGDDLYFMEHETNDANMIFSSDSGYVTLLNADNGVVNFQIVLNSVEAMNYQMNGITGEIIRQEIYVFDADTISSFPVGDSVFIQKQINDDLLLYLDEKSVLPDGAHIRNDPCYFQDNLLIEYWYTSQAKGNILATANGDIIDLPTGEYLTGTSNFLFYLPDGSNSDLYCYEINSGESWLVYDELDVYQAVTDGYWLYTCVPWNGGRTDCWCFELDDLGRPIGLVLISTDI